MTTYLHWYPLMITCSGGTYKHENIFIKGIDSQKVHFNLYIPQIRNICSPTTFYWNQMLQRLYLIPMFITIVSTHHQNHGTTMNQSLTYYPINFNISLICFTQYPSPWIRIIVLQFIPTPTSLSSSLMLIPPWLSLGEDWRLVFSPPAGHLNLVYFLGLALKGWV